MASLYKHKKYGFQVHYRIYFSDGTSLKKYRYASVQADANVLYMKADYLERGSRRGDLRPEEVAAARRDGLVSEAEARLISGGRVVAFYDLDLIMEKYEASSAVANTPYGHKVNMRRARFIKEWLRRRPIPSLTDGDVKQYVLGRKNGSIVYRNKRTGFALVGVSQKTIRNEVEILRAIIGEALKLGMVDKNVAHEVDVPVWPPMGYLLVSCRRLRITSVALLQ